VSSRCSVNPHTSSTSSVITFWGEVDRQRLLPFGTPDQIHAAVRRVRAALDDGTGGVIAQCEWGVNDPLENVMTVFEEWERPREARGPLAGQAGPPY